MMDRRVLRLLLLLWLRDYKAHSMMGAERSLVTVLLSRTCANGLGLVGEGGGEANSEVILLLSAMLYGRGRKVLTLWGGRECSFSDSGVRAW